MANPRQDIIDVLHEAQVDFPPSATTAQLRNLLRNVVGGHSSAASGMSSNADCGVPDDVDTITNADADAVPNAATDVDDCAADMNIRATAVPITTADAVYGADAVPPAVTVSSVVAAAAITDVVTASSAAITDVVTASSAAASTAPNAVPRLADLDREVLALKKRLEMLKLMQQIEELENRSATKCHRKLDFGDIEHALPKFNGDDVAYPVEHFIRDFEEIMQSTGADENFKLLALRRSLTGTARVFLSTTTALNYCALKGALMKEFNFAVTRQEIYKMLSQRRWRKKDESMHCYVLSMQAIAKRANIAEQEVVDFIIDGIGNSVPNSHLLLSAQNTDELKAIISRYQNKYFATKTIDQKPPTAVKQKTEQKQLCYNCSQTGHIKPNCPFPLRPDGSCFKCWRMGHDHRACPNPRKILKRKDDVAAVVEYSDDAEIVGEHNYSGQFY
ncbi:uncharacterized protein LOC118756790 [Rhagoletis pomonella]|uniref:uncharacterized protein LOC118756790 n=1 Tax=Rhagoletis pomonella TaxID=28610 RepID=UPI0017866B07|nr:uncharacterized protein LOC118756790 [Rhagoletis pomonella]